MNEPKALCWSRGPRIGEDGVPYCKLPARHADPNHRPDPEDGWGAVSWVDPPMVDYGLRARDQWEQIVKDYDERKAFEESIKPKYPDIEVQLTGEDGNGFFIAARVRTAIRNHLFRVDGWDRSEASDEALSFFNEALSGNYEHLLDTCQRWVTVR